MSNECTAKCDEPTPNQALTPLPTAGEFLQELTACSRQLVTTLPAGPEKQRLTELLERTQPLMGPTNELDNSPYFNPPPVTGDVLPAVGELVLIHLSRQDEWVAHQVVGFYAWKDLSGSDCSVRLFVRVRDRAGYLNARLLTDVLRMDKTPFLS